MRQWTEKPWTRVVHGISTDLSAQIDDPHEFVVVKQQNWGIFLAAMYLVESTALNPPEQRLAIWLKNQAWRSGKIKPERLVSQLKNPRSKKAWKNRLQCLADFADTYHQIIIERGLWEPVWRSKYDQPSIEELLK